MSMRRRKTGPVTWHIYARGARRLDLFRDDDDRREFLRLLELFAGFTKSLLWAYALMSNHYHLVLHGSSAQLTALMLRLNHQYAIYHNRKYSLSGHMLDGPYQAHPVSSPILVLRKIAYVLLNPLKAGMETAIGDYPWTSLRSLRGEGWSPLKLDLTTLWEVLDSDREEGLRRFETMLEREMARPVRQRRGLLSATELQEQEFEWLLDFAHEVRATLRGEDPVDVACHWARLAGIPPRAMARPLGIPSTRVRSALHRFRKKLSLNAALENALSLP